VQLPASRLAATALATAALALGGLTAGAGTAQAAATVQCAGGFSLNEGFGGFTASACNAFSPDGGPYTVTIAAFSAESNIPGGGFATLPYTDVNLTCQAVVAHATTTPGVYWDAGSSCVATGYTYG
jgi:hypothetical protein